MVAQKTGKNSIIAYISGINVGKTSIINLLENGTITASLQGIIILDYNFSIFRSNGDLVVYHGIGNTLSESIKAEIRSASLPVKIVIEDINGRTTEGKLVRLQPIALEINE